MSRRPPVTGIGVAPRDLTVLVDPLPEPDTKGRARAFAESGGGPVPNALVTLARLGHRCHFGGVVGDDEAGRFVAEALRRDAVETPGLVTRNGFRTPTSIILVDGAGRRRVCEWNQTDLPFSPADLQPMRAAIASCAALLVDARFPEAQADAARHARASGALVVLDCGHPRPGCDALLPLCDVAIFSHSYLEAMQVAPSDEGAFLDALRARLAPAGPRIAGVTLGADGCLVVSDEGTSRVAGSPTAAVDTTGAGDVFHGAFTHALLRGDAPPAAARFANAVAAWSCRGLTGRAPLPPEEEMDRW